MDHNGIDDHAPMPGHFYYPQEPDYIGYTGGMGYNTVPQHAPQPRSLDMHGNVQTFNLPLQYGGNVFAAGPQQTPHGTMPGSGSPPPPSPELHMYEGAMSPPVSGSESAGEHGGGLYHHSNSSGTNSASHSRSNSLVHRTPRHHPTSSPTSSVGRRRSRSRGESDEDDFQDPNTVMGVTGIQYTENLAFTRKEATRKQRIEAEQRRRDELRDGYQKLKEVLPSSTQKSSKVSLLERATNWIVELDRKNKLLEERVAAMEAEMERIRIINEKITLSMNGTPSPRLLGAKDLSPPPSQDHHDHLQKTPPAVAHSLTSVKGLQPPSEHSSPSASETGSY